MAVVEAPAVAVESGTPRAVVFVLMVVAFAVAPFVVYPVFLMKALCFALFACAFNLLIGYGGLLSFGHAAYLGSAGYVAAHAAKVWGWSPELAIAAGTLSAVILGVAIGALAIRRQGIYFAMITLTYGLGVGLAALAGVLSAPINQVRPLMGENVIIVVFAVVVIGGMGSIMGSIITGFALGVIEGLTKYFYPEASNTVVFVLMVLVLLVKPTGLTGKAA